jgi:hypothetical protein
MSLLVNLFAGPGAGKSTMAAGLFHVLKSSGVLAELVTEYAKDLTWEQAWKKQAHAFKILGEQTWRVERVYADTDVVITDSPILLSSIYNDKAPEFYHQTVEWAHDQYENLNFYIKRVKPYIQKGRTQNFSRAQYIDEQTKKLLNRLGVPFDEVTGDDDGLASIVEEVMNALHSE